MSRDDGVTIKFVRDFHTPDGSVTYTKDSEHRVDPVTADALLLAGVAVKISGVAARGSQTPPAPGGGS
jgi:hypothetical protein